MAPFEDVDASETSPRQREPIPLSKMQDRSESELVEAVRAGDRAAAEVLVCATYEQIFASLVRLCGSRDLAADLAQDTYRSAWSRLPAFEGRSRFSTWLYRIAYHTFLNHKRRPVLMTPLDDQRQVVDPAPGIEAQVGQAELDQRLRRFVVELPDELRLTVTARFWGGVPAEEIARLENITRSAVRKRLSKAKRLLRRRFEQGEAS